MTFAETTDPFELKRKQMVEDQIERRGITSKQVLDSLRGVPRHLFVPEKLQSHAYDDYPLAIGFGQTISQPYIVAYMTEAANLKAGDRVLEIGTGSGYQAAILAEIVKEVYSVEIVKELAESSQKRLTNLGYRNIFIKHGDGYQGWLEHAPFDAIIVTAAPQEIPPKLVEQLEAGGRMVIPVGSFFQELYLITKTSQGFEKRQLLPVQFVPMIQSKER